MAAKTAGTWVGLGQIGINPDAVFGTTKLYDLGTKVKARDMGTTAYGDGEFIYLEGVASTVRGSVVFITSALATTLVVARSCGAVAVALAANAAASSYGWYQLSGKGVAACDTTSDAQPLYIDGTAGRVDDSAVAGDQIIGMRSASADDTSTLVFSAPNGMYVADFDNA